MLENNEEKIVSLATELLKNNAYKRQFEFPKNRNNLSINISTVLIATLMAAASGYHAGAYGCYTHRPLNRYERVELQALIFYASKVKNLQESMIKHEVEVFIGTPLSEMSVKDFPAARSFLQDVINPNQRFYYILI